MILRYAVPALLSALSLALAFVTGLARVAAVDAYHPFFFGIAGYVICTYWLLLALRRAPAPHGRGNDRLLVGARLAVGAPTAGLLVFEVLNALLGRDEYGWTVVAVVLIPFLLIWPVVLLTLRGIQDPA